MKEFEEGMINERHGANLDFLVKFGLFIRLNRNLILKK